MQNLLCVGAGLGTASGDLAKEDHLPTLGRLLPAGWASEGRGWVLGGGSDWAVNAPVTCVCKCGRLGWGCMGGLNTQAPNQRTSAFPDGFGVTY